MFVQLKDFPDYAVTDEGEVVSLKFGRWKVLRASPDSDGYPQIHVSVAGKKSPKKVHSLVAEAFLGTRPEGLEVNHKNGIKTDNSPDNLEYVTQSENMQHAWDLGLREENRKTLKQRAGQVFGEAHPRTKLTNSQILQLYSLRGSMTAAEAGALFGLSRPQVSKIWNKQSHKGLLDNAE